ncbi:cytochrome P450 [Rhypophila sp. PSN 637]
MAGRISDQAVYVATGSFLTGIGIHLALFIRGEWHVYSPHIVSYYGLLLGFSLCLHVWYAKFIPIFAVFSHIAGIFASIFIYRLIFHRLNRAGLPGPFWARFSKLPHVWKIRDSKNHIYLHKIHVKYGEVVRTGPAEVTIFLPEALEAVGGRQSTCIKGEFYDLLWPELALFAARDKSLHAKRRRDWNAGFSPQAIKIHEKKVLRHVQRLDQQLRIEVASGNVVNVTEFLLWFTFDIMTDFTFSGSLNLLQEDKCRQVVVKARRARSTLGPLTPAPWLLQVGLKLLPRIWWIKDWNDSITWAHDQIQDRLSRKVDDKDLVSYLMEPKTTSREELGRWLKGDSLLAILAGSEPTGQSLAGVFHELARHPDQIRKLRNDLKGISLSDNKALVEVPHLNAVLQEAMRLHANLLTGGVRKTAETGLRFGDGIYIPPHTTVVTPLYTISRREDCFEHAEKFIPERWTSRREMVRNAQAHVPFSLGRYNCVGQELGMRIVRYTVAMVVTHYDFCYAPGHDGSEMELGKSDRFTAFPGKVPLCFTLVSKAEV